MTETVDLLNRPRDAAEASIVVFRTSKDLDVVLPELNRLLGSGQ